MADDVEERMEVAPAGHPMSALQQLIPSENAKTRQATNYGIRLFREYGARHGCPNIHDVPEHDIARLLKGFYGAVRTKDGQRFSVNSLIAIRYAISRFYRSGQVVRKIDIVKDPAFDEANEAFRNILRDLDRDAGRIVPCQKDIVDADDRRKLRYYFEHAITTPRGLLQKVWYDLMLHLGRRGRDGQRLLRKEAFRIVLDRDGRRYVYLNEEEEGGGVEIIMEKPGDPLCPVRTFALYLSRLNPACEALFQRPKDRITKQDVFWYVNSPIGKNMLATMMSTISKCAGLSRVYTNLRVRATAYGGSSCINPTLVAAATAGNSSMDTSELNDADNDENSLLAESALQHLLMLQSCQVSRLDESESSKLVQSLTSGILARPSEVSSETALMVESKNQPSTSMQDVAKSATTVPAKTCLQCGTVATLQFSSQGISQVFCSVSCFQTYSDCGKKEVPEDLSAAASPSCSSSCSSASSTTSENGVLLSGECLGEEDKDLPVVGRATSPLGTPGSRCVACQKEMKSHGGFLLSADKLGKKLFCSTLCLAHWVSRDQTQGSQLSPFTGHCDYCLSKRPLKRQVVGNNNVIHHFCSDECTMCYQTLLMNGLVPGQGPNAASSNTVAVNAANALENGVSRHGNAAEFSNSVISSVMSLAAVSRRFGINLGEIAQSASTLGNDVAKRDQSTTCKPAMVSVAVLCKPSSFAQSKSGVRSQTSQGIVTNHVQAKNGLAINESQNATPDCTLEDLSTKPLVDTPGFESLYTEESEPHDLSDPDKHHGTEASRGHCDEVASEGGDGEGEGATDDEDEGGMLSMEAEVCIEEGPPMQRNDTAYWDYPSVNGSTVAPVQLNHLNGHQLSSLCYPSNLQNRNNMVNMYRTDNMRNGNSSMPSHNSVAALLNGAAALARNGPNSNSPGSSNSGVNGLVSLLQQVAPWCGAPVNGSLTGKHPWRHPCEPAMHRGSAPPSQQQRPPVGRAMGAAGSSPAVAGFDFSQRRLGRTTKRFSWEEIAERSKSQTMWAVKLFRDWLVTNFRPPDFEHLQADHLASELHDFYENLVKPDGEDYSVSTLNSVRASINRYLTLPPHSKPFSIIFSREFRKANEAFFTRVRTIQQISLSTTFTSDDMQKILSSEALSAGHPNGLFRRVWFCLVLVLGGKHGTIFPLLTKDCFRIVQDENGQNQLIFHFAPSFLPTGSEIKVRVRQSNSTLCPVSAVGSYLAKLSPQCDAFFQTPNHPLVSQAVGEMWFLPRPLPDSRLKGMMKEISSAAGLSRIYSNQALQTMASNQGTEGSSGPRGSDLLKVAGLAEAILEQ